jgi:hypothetical protein
MLDLTTRQALFLNFLSMITPSSQDPKLPFERQPKTSPSASPGPLNPIPAFRITAVVAPVATRDPPLTCRNSLLSRFGRRRS